MTIQAFFGFAQPPFSRDLPPDQRFRCASLDELHARLAWLVETCAIGTVVGEPGSGKSTALRRLRDSLHPELVRPIYIHDTDLLAPGFYTHLALNLGLEPFQSRARTFRAIRDEIDRLHRERHLTVLLVVDEAHRMRSEVLAELPVLTSFDWDGQARLPVLLSGLTGLLGRLRMAVLEPLAQRITVRYALRGFDRDTTRTYLEHRLRVAGLDRPLFTEPAIEALFDASQGLMRRIDTIALHALHAAAARRDRLVDTDHIRAGAEEIRT
ncbi:MAG: AAA family ATPase [Elusimicrobia bacterium]|nr:AAA family ATPase [Elusimicrobiota bacterium]